MHVRPYEEPLMQYDEYKAHKILLLYVPPLLIVLGTIGNILSFCVLMRKAMRRTSTYNYLAVLSFTDMLVLYVGLLRLWVAELVGYDVRDQSDWSCKLIGMLGYTVSVYSVWLLIAVTVERYIVIVHSLHASTMCTRSRAMKIILGIIIVLILLNAHFLKTLQIRYYDGDEQGNSEIPICDGAKGYEILVVEVWPWIDACLYSFIPFGTISVLNALIIHKVIMARRNRQMMSSASSASHSLRHGGQSGGVSESSTKLTIMLLTISFTFLITTLPMNVTLITQVFWDSHAPNIEVASKFKLARTISELLMYTNHSVNFYLYMLTGQKFRQQLALMFCPRIARRWTSDSVYTHVSNVDRKDRNGTGKNLNCTELTVYNNNAGTYTRVSNMS